ncbi:MAG: hypothetical protein H6853_02125 [Rhodospirillales bacterium]|nr:hypothetical protein [Alphaproteobacteria bacterium]USO04096.1 MAG: hypothetical protein H6853_02125 [Rhodospirillales bacterium]
MPISANRANPDDYPPGQYQFYCPDCYEDHNHFTRLVRVAPYRSSPAKFHLYARMNSTHQCDHPVRTRDLDLLAARYNAATRARHSYSFSMNMAGANFIEKSVFAVHRATRLAKITYQLLYDEGLRKNQALRIQGEDISFEDAFYDDDGKGKLYQAALAAARKKNPLYVAGIFRPIGLRAEWKRFADENNAPRCIPGIAGKAVTYKGEKLRPSSVLMCASSCVYDEVRKITDRNGKRTSSPLIVFARAALNLERLDRRVERLKAGSPEAHAAYTGLVIESADQVAAWDHPVSFKKAVEQQDAGPRVAPPLLRMRG